MNADKMANVSLVLVKCQGIVLNMWHTHCILAHIEVLWGYWDWWRLYALFKVIHLVKSRTWFQTKFWLYEARRYVHCCVVIHKSHLPNIYHVTDIVLCNLQAVKSKYDLSPNLSLISMTRILTKKVLLI